MNALISGHSRRAVLVGVALCAWLGLHADRANGQAAITTPPAGQIELPELGKLPPMTQGITTVFVVRHAEKAQAPFEDPPLSLAGQQRALDLALALEKARVTVIFATKAKRAQQTAKPLADLRGLPVNDYPDAKTLAEAIKSKLTGRRVLVVGHLNTIQPIATALGAMADDCAIAGDEFDNLCVVTIPPPGKETPVHGVNLQYGNSSPSP